MLGHSLRRWPNIKSTLAERLVFTGGSDVETPWFMTVKVTGSLTPITTLDKMRG